jgi:uncharacterized membrane protein
LLGLSYLWTDSVNGIKLQIWATWLFYAVLLDVADAVADELELSTLADFFRNAISRILSL